MTNEEKETIEFLKFSLLDYEELDTGVLEYIDEKRKKVLNYIDKLQKENEKLKEKLHGKNSTIVELNNLIAESIDNSISKDKIRNKIKELEAEYEKCEKEGLSNFLDKLDIGTRIEGLKELLGDDE